MIATLNLVFHRIVDSDRDVTSSYDVGCDFFESVLNETKRWVATQDVVQQVRVYFDDNYRSTLTFGLGGVTRAGFMGVAAVPVESIGLEDFCTFADLQILRSGGFRIVPHGFSHAALAIYENEILVPTPPGGIYRATPPGRDRVLTTEEVHFQLRESKLAIAPLMSAPEFVLPYGLFNKDTVSINRHHGLFDFLTTCDPFVDTGELLRPRFLVTERLTLKATVETIRTLKTRQR